MQATKNDLESLLKVQQIDLEILQTNKKIDELPQRQTIIKARAKRETINENHKKIDGLKKDASRRLSSINDEDASLQKKENGVTVALQAVSDDFRGVEARSKELAGIVSRREKLNADRAQIEQELEKIGQLELNLALALDEVDEMENKATETFKHDGGILKEKIMSLENEREEILSHINSDIVKAYKKTSLRTGSVAIGKLDGNKCGICRSNIDGGRLIDLQAQAPLGVCPSCKRLLIIEK